MYLIQQIDNAEKIAAIDAEIYSTILFHCCEIVISDSHFLPCIGSHPVYTALIIGTVHMKSMALVQILKRHFYNKTNIIISNIAVEIGNIDNNKCLSSSTDDDVHVYLAVGIVVTLMGIFSIIIPFSIIIYILYRKKVRTAPR